MTLRIAMIGAGGVAQRHARVLGELDGARVVSVVDPVPEAASALARATGARALAEVGDALDEADAAYVCVPPFAHGDAEAAVLERDLPLFVEKPVGVDLAGAERIAALVEKAGVVTGTGYHWRCLDTVALLREELAGRPPLLATGHWWGTRPAVGWWQHMDRSGGQVIEQLTHVTDLARMLLGTPTAVTAVGGRAVAGAPDVNAPLREGSDVDDATAALVRFESGAALLLSATCALDSLYGAGLIVTAPGLVAEIGEEQLRLTHGRQSRTIATGEDPRVVVDREFLEAVRGEREQATVPYAEALATHRLGLAITEAVRTGGSVHL